MQKTHLRAVITFFFKIKNIYSEEHINFVKALDREPKFSVTPTAPIIAEDTLINLSHSCWSQQEDGTNSDAKVFPHDTAYGASVILDQRWWCTAGKEVHGDKLIGI